MAADPDAAHGEGLSYGGLVHQSEELRDERINQDLHQAYLLKGQGGHQKALELYLTVLGQDFIKNSHLEQHVHMRQNAHKNAGEIYEELGRFQLAKDHYTQALKIRENDSWVWTKIGMIEYLKYGHLQVAQQCFEAAISTRPTLQRRSAAISPILVKLAEINFKLSNFEKCEGLVDSILLRANAPNMDQASRVFALKLKAFFHALKGEEEKKDALLAQLVQKASPFAPAPAEAVAPTYHDLPLIQGFFQKMKQRLQRHGSKGVPMWNPREGVHKFLKIKGLDGLEEADDALRMESIRLAIGGEDESRDLSLGQLYNALLEKLALGLEEVKESKGLDAVANMSVDVGEISEAAKALVERHTLPDTQELVYSEEIELPAESEDQAKANEEQVPAKEQVVTTQTKGKGRGASKAAAHGLPSLADGRAGAQQSASAQPQMRRGLRRKMDFTEQQLSQINLKSLDQYKDYIVSEYQQSINRKSSGGLNQHQRSGHDGEASKLMDFVFSQKDLICCKKLIENKQLFKNAQNQSSLRGQRAKAQNLEIVGAVEGPSKIRTLSANDLLGFVKLLRAIDGKRVLSTLRTILLFSLDHATSFTNSRNSVHLYKLFQYLMIAEGPFSQAWIQKKKQPWELYAGVGIKNDLLNLSGDSLNALICLFELSLFNKQIIKEVKSGPMMEQRQIMFDYFHVNEELTHRLLEERCSRASAGSNEQDAVQVRQECQELQIRLIYAMMYCAFEIKNDMMLSVTLYHKLQSFLSALASREISIHLPIIDREYYLDSTRMAEFGDFKIKQAKVFKDYDSGLMRLKQREHQLLLRAGGKGRAPPRGDKSKEAQEMEEEEAQIDEAEFDKYACFYLDQFFLYLNASVAITTVAPRGGWLSSQGAQTEAASAGQSQQEKSQTSANACTQIQNEEKVKEMWQQLIYSLCRARPALLFKAAQNLFCVFTTISYLNKNFYEQFILKKLDFQKLISSIHQRLQAAYHDIEEEFRRNSVHMLSIAQLKEFTAKRLAEMLGLRCEEVGSAELVQIEAVLMRLQVTLLRQITPEFLHYNIFLTQASNTAFQNMMSQSGLQTSSHLPYGSAGSSLASSGTSQPNLSIILGMGQPFGQTGFILDLFPQILFYFEFFKSILNGDTQRDNSHNLRTVLRLLVHFDKLTVQNEEKKEIFCRAYAQLVVHAFPMLLKCLRIDVDRQALQNESTTDETVLSRLRVNEMKVQALRELQSKGPASQIQLSSTTSLVLLMSQIFLLFFNMKLSLDAIDEQQSAGGAVNLGDRRAKDQRRNAQHEDEDMNQEDEERVSEDEDEEDMYYRRWAHLSCVLGQLKREKQTKNWAQAQFGPGLQNKSPMLQFFLNNCSIDASLFADMISVICFFTQNRPMRHGELTFKDIKVMQTFNEVLLDYYTAHHSQIQEKLTSSPGNALFKKFKELNKNNPFEGKIDPTDFQISPEVEVDMAENRELNTVIVYINNLIAHTVLVWAPCQIARFDIAIRVGSSGGGQAQASGNQAQGPSYQAGAGGLFNSFYFAYTKKGGALGNFPVQIAKIHETILTQISKLASSKIGEASEPVPEAGNPATNSFYQFKNLSNLALRNFSRLIRLDLLQYPLYLQRSSALRPTSEEQVEVVALLQPLLDQQRLSESLLSVSYLQSLVHFQQYINHCTQTLFISGTDLKQQGTAAGAKAAGGPGTNEGAVPPKKSSQESERRQRYLQRAVQSAAIALRALVEKQRTMQQVPQEYLAHVEQIESATFAWSDMNFFQLSKMVLEQMLAIVLGRIKVIKSKHSLRSQVNPGLSKLPSASSNAIQEKHEKVQAKLLCLKTVAFLIATMCDHIDILSAPSRDPRINHKLKRTSALAMALEVLEHFLSLLKQTVEEDPKSFQKCLLRSTTAEACLQKLCEMATQHNVDSRTMERLNLNFMYSYVQAKYCGSLPEKFGYGPQFKFMTLRRSLEIAQANKNIHGVLETIRKLIKGSLEVAIALKYRKQSLAPNDLKEKQTIIQGIVKPILQDPELKKYIYKDLGQSVLSGLRELDAPEGSMPRQPHFGGHEEKEGRVLGSHHQFSSAQIDESQIVQDTNSCRIRPQLIARDKGTGDELLGDFSSGLIREENDLIQIYKVADFVTNNLGNSTKQWLKAKFQLMCTKSLLMELQEQERTEGGRAVQSANGEPRVPPEMVKLLVDMLKPLDAYCITYEDVWNGMIYDESDDKNMLTSMGHHELLGLTRFRLKFLLFFISLCQNALDYEPVKEIYKKKLWAFKQLDQGGVTPILTPGSTSFHFTPSATSTLFSLKILFDKSLDSYLYILCRFIDDQLQKYRQARATVLESQQSAQQKKGPADKQPEENKWKQRSVRQAKELFEQLRSHFQVTKENLPAALKEIFDAFVEVHSRKSYLVTRRLVGDQHRKMVVKAVLDCCAMCGPDNLATQVDKNKVGKAGAPKANAAKFLDLAKLSEADYQIDGLKMCITWYLDVLEKVHVKRNLDQIKRLKAVADEVLGKK